MSEINSQALREAAEKAGEDKWQAKKINGDFFVIRHGSYTRQHGYTSYQPIAEIDCKPVRDFVAKANPATVLELLDELEAAKKRIAELEAREILLPERSSMLHRTDLQDSMATHRINPLRRLIVSQSGILLPRLIRLPCWNYWMNWKQQKSALQNWKRGKYCSRNVAACFIEQIFTMITKR